MIFTYIDIVIKCGWRKITWIVWIIWANKTSIIIIIKWRWYCCNWWTVSWCRWRCAWIPISVWGCKCSRPPIILFLRLFVSWTTRTNQNHCLPIRNTLFFKYFYFLFFNFPKKPKICFCFVLFRFCSAHIFRQKSQQT